MKTFAIVFIIVSTCLLALWLLFIAVVKITRGISGLWYIYQTNHNAKVHAEFCRKVDIRIAIARADYVMKYGTRAEKLQLLKDQKKNNPN